MPDPTPAPDLPVGTIVTIGHPGNGRLAVHASDGWHDLAGAAHVDPDDFRVGWTRIGPVSAGNVPTGLRSLAESASDAVMGVLADVADELGRAVAKFPGQHLPLGFGQAADGWIPGEALYTAADWRDLFRNLTDNAADDGTLTWRHVLTEEEFEAFAEDDPAKARAELAQLAAMCVRAILDIDDPQPVAFTGPSGRAWRQLGVNSAGQPVLILTRPAPGDVNQSLTPPSRGKATDPQT